MYVSVYLSVCIVGDRGECCARPDSNFRVAYFIQQSHMELPNILYLTSDFVLVLTIQLGVNYM